MRLGDCCDHPTALLVIQLGQLGTTMDRSQLLKATAQIVAAHVAKNPGSIENTATLIRGVFDKLSALQAEPGKARAAELEPAVPINKSVSNGYLVCLEDGARMKTLKRHLRRFGLTPQQYREKWGLPSDYPMTAPSYSRLRSRMAKKVGLGTKGVRRRRRG